MLAFIPQGTQLRHPASASQDRTAKLALILLFEIVLIASGCASLSSSTSGGASAEHNISVTANLVPAQLGSAYAAGIAVSGGRAPYHFSIVAGALPPGLSMSSASGTISGMPHSQGTYGFTVRVSDESGENQGQQALSIFVKSSGNTGVTVSVTPATATLTSGQSLTFSAVVTGNPNGMVTWTATGGSISARGGFNAPQVQAATNIQVTATSIADSTKSATAVVTVNPPPPAAVTVQAGALPAGTQGSAYSASLAASGGVPPYSWSLQSGSLPNGVQLASGGSLSGTPQATGSYNFSLQVSDSKGSAVSGNFSLAVSGATQTGQFDGPAELPQVYMQTAMSDTPAPGAIHSVNTTATLQAAIASANCGDTIQLQAGATFEGFFRLPQKPCDDNHWIIIRTSSPDSVLPPEGTRLAPCYAGVASLPGRPPFSCPSQQNVLAKLSMNGVGSGPIIFSNGANHYRFVGLEITRDAPGAIVYNLAANQVGGAADHIIFDRVWMHGTAQDETTRGVGLSGSTYLAVIDSYLNDFHCISNTGACGDAQAIAGGLGDLPQGPYKIVDNFLESSGENLMFGGGEATQTPTDIEIRRNHLFKPLTWMRGQPGYVGGRNGRPFIVKNHFELKNGARVLFEGNILENTWGGFTQSGFSILLTPKNQHGYCAQCQVHDVTIRYSTISHVGSAIVVGNGRSDSGALSKGAWNESIHDLLITDIDMNKYAGGGYLLLEVNGNPNNVVHDVVVNHVTALSKESQGSSFVVGNDVSDPAMYNFSWTNSIFSANGSGFSSVGGGPSNCAYGGGGVLGILNRCYTAYSFSHNVLIGNSNSWPSDNHVVSTGTQVFGSNTPSGVSSYALVASSPFKNSSSDGTDPGANISALEAAIAGVQ
jgi:hypothetical protein